MPRPEPPKPLSPTTGQLWKRLRGPLAVIAILVGAALLMAVINSGNRRGYLDPQGVDQGGSGAVVQLLKAQGVDVAEATTIDAALGSAERGTTMLITVPDLLQLDQAERILGSGADLVLVGPRNADFLGNGVAVTGSAQPGLQDPECRDSGARRAGSARMGGLLYGPPDARSSSPSPASNGAGSDSSDTDSRRSADARLVAACYPYDDGASLVMLDHDGTAITVLGASDILTNRYVDEDGNAALALGLLGKYERLIWYRPSLEAGQSGTADVWELLPEWVAPVVVQLFVVALVTTLWRARRLGPVVSEPLPVVVRAAEVVEGRAGLYRRAGARDRASAALRQASATRLARHLGLPRAASPAAVMAAVVGRTGRSEAEVGGLLAGPTPADDAALVHLAHSLDTLEQEVRRT